MTEAGILDDLLILRFLPDDVRSLVVRHFAPVSFPFGGVLAAEGEPTDALYVIVSGRARVIKTSDTGDEIPLNILRAGDSFGEVDLLDGGPRPATVRASSDVVARPCAIGVVLRRSGYRGGAARRRAWRRPPGVGTRSDRAGAPGSGSPARRHARPRRRRVSWRRGPGARLQSDR